MWTSHHCRHCGDTHNKCSPIGIKKRTKEQVYEYATEYLDKLKVGDHFFAEKIAEEYKVRTYQVRQVLHRLNLEGKVTQKTNNPPHDSTRDRWGGGSDSAWMASYYYKK